MLTNQLYTLMDDPTAMEFILEGGKGVISVAANVAPKWVHCMAEAASRNNRDEAEKWNAKLEILYETLYVESSPIPTKWVLSKMGLIDSGIRLPLTPLSESHHSEVQAAIEQVSLTA